MELTTEMNQSGWLRLLFGEEAAVPVAVYEGKYRRTPLLLQATSSAREADLHC